MKRIGDSSEDEMILAFLQAEIDSDKRRQQIKQVLESLKCDESIIREGDITNKLENSLRRVLLDYRGFRFHDLLFNGFPEDVQWEVYNFTLNELEDFYYIRSLEFCEFTHDTRKIKDSVSAILKNIGRPQTINDFQGAITALKSGKIFPHAIAVTDKTRIVLLEGHKRITAYCYLNGQCEYQPKFILGYSSNIHKWNFF